MIFRLCCSEADAWRYWACSVRLLWESSAVWGTLQGTGRRYVCEHVAVAMGPCAGGRCHVHTVGGSCRAAPYGGLFSGALGIVGEPPEGRVVSVIQGATWVISLRDREACSPGGRRKCVCFAFWGEHWYANEGYTVATLRALKGKEGVLGRGGWWPVYMYSVQQVSIDTW